MLNSVMASEINLSDRDALIELWNRVGTRRLTALASLTMITGLSEGAGLVLLVPVVHLLAAGSAADLPAIIAPLHALPAATLLMMVVGLMCTRAMVVFAANEQRREIGLQLSHDFRADTHQAIMQAEWSWLASQDSADHAAMIVGESERSASLFNDAISMQISLGTLAILSVAALVVSPALTLALLAVGIPSAWAAAYFGLRRGRQNDAYWTAFADMQNGLANGIARLRAARIAGSERELSDQFASASAELSEFERIYFRRAHQSQLIFQISAVCALAIAIYLTTQVWNVGVAVLVPVLFLAIRAVPLLSRLHLALRSWRYNLPALARLREHLAIALRNRMAQDQNGHAPEFQKSIELHNISLRYSSRARPVLANFSLSILKGQFVSVIGTSGSGKSSLGDIACGLTKPDAGQVLVDGVPLTNAGRSAWRGKIGYLEQSPFFLNQSLRENLLWGLEDTTDSALHSALKHASADFVLEWPDGLATQMGDGGLQLSGGELRRIALARTLLRAPDLLILDEFTASLDRTNRDAILDVIGRLKGSVTILALTHDEKVTQMADVTCDLDLHR